KKRKVPTPDEIDGMRSALLSYERTVKPGKAQPSHEATCNTLKQREPGQTREVAEAAVREKVAAPALQALGETTVAAIEKTLMAEVAADWDCNCALSRK